LDYFGLKFILNNFSKFSKAIINVEEDINKGILKKSDIPEYIKWKESIGLKTQFDENGELVNGEEIKKTLIENNKIFENNPFLKALYSKNSISTNNSSCLIQQKCAICDKQVQQHDSFGFVSCCCGAFFCRDCAKSMCSKRSNERSDKSGSNEQSENTYCVVCHKQNPTYFINSTHHPKFNLQSWHIINEFTTTDSTTNTKHFDYYFKMFNDGFTVKYSDGRKLDLEFDDENQVVQLYQKDRILIHLISSINSILSKLEIKPGDSCEIKPSILIYDAPLFIQKRMKDYFSRFSHDKNSSLYQMDIIFKRDMSERIGLHHNILGIIVYNEPSNIDEINQLIGRILRLNTWNNVMYFYITFKND
jgi:hypothetical protein